MATASKVLDQGIGQGMRRTLGAYSDPIATLSDDIVHAFDYILI